MICMRTAWFALVIALSMLLGAFIQMSFHAMEGRVLAARALDDKCVEEFTSITTEHAQHDIHYMTRDGTLAFETQDCEGGAADG